MTLNIPEFNNFRGRSRSEGDVSSLSEVLVRGRIAPRYFLTAKCAAGMLRRVAKRGKQLPAMLERALTALDGTVIEPQDIPLSLHWSRLPPETLLLAAGAWLLAKGQVPEIS